MPKVSIVIPCYNHGEFLLETLDSVQSQSFEAYEVVIVDDGSTDPATCQLLRTLNRPKVKVLHTKNQGVSAARNRAIAEASGEYILPLDADDMIAPTYLEKAVAVLDLRPEVAVVFGGLVMFGERDGVVPLPAYDPRHMLVENLIYSASVFRKKDWTRTGGYCEAMTYGWEDWEFWISLSCLGGVVVKLPEPMLFYRVRNSSRDHSLRFFRKLAMFSLMVWRHKILYLRNFVYVVSRLLAHSIKRHPNF